MLSNGKSMNFLNEEFWLALSFFIFIYFVYKPIRKLVLSSLDKYISTIKNDIESATEARKKAELLLEELSKKLEDLKNKKNAMILEAKEETDSFIEREKKEIEIVFHKKKDIAIDLIEKSKDVAIESINRELCEITTKICEQYFLNMKNNISELELAKNIAKIKNLSDGLN